ncbi:ABC transporter ATP-binding protein [Ponticoccus litoralis]|uniref:ABC transporter ATP-binding protein n=1 Tax=Ponticoccus litoralis TaxID=422297 RepID=A0AAW9S8F4_9RHOB
MSLLASLLEDFGSPGSGGAVEPEAPGIGEAEIEGAKLEAFEKGYKAGWDDAVKAQSDDRTRISSAFGQHLQDLSFTYHEAYSQVMSAVAPILNEMAGTVLPQIARATLSQHIADQLDALTQEIGALDVVIAVAPARVEAVQGLLQQDFGFPIKLAADATLNEDQADIRFGETERQIDLGELIASVTEAVEGFTHDNQRKIAHG